MIEARDHWLRAFSLRVLHGTSSAFEDAATVAIIKYIKRKQKGFMMQNMWGPPNYMDSGRAAVAEAEADAAWDSAQAASRNAALWRQNAQEWQTAYEKLELDGHCRTHAQASLKEAALEELARLVPDHPLLNKEHRKQLYDAAYQKRHDDIVAQRKAEAQKREAERQAALKKTKRKKRIKWAIILAIVAFSLYHYHFWIYFL